ncbi:MAG: transposase [Nanoarchaeota archaeon]|nr:transposase [Nanoarchaeota archaeon]
MPNFRRYYIPDAIVFITGVTRKRQHFLRAESDVNLLFETLRNVQLIHPFRLLAYVLLPDHFHWLMRVVSESGNFSEVMQSIKRNFTLNYKHAHHINTTLNIWQPRFWDHVIRNEHDLEKHFDYVHWNPVKHGYVRYPEDWPHSTYAHWLKLGYYGPEWGRGEEPSGIAIMDFE